MSFQKANNKIRNHARRWPEPQVRQSGWRNRLLDHSHLFNCTRYNNKPKTMP